MRTANVPIPEIALIAATRGMLGMGLGLLLASRLRPSKRRKVALPLIAIGAISTVPLLTDVFRRAR